MLGRAVALPGATVLVTGASSGIGRALAVELARRGATVAVAARREHLLRELAAEIEAAGGARPHVIVADLGVRGGADDLARQAAAAFGGAVDVLVNNAGASLTGASSRVADSDPARVVFETNLWSPLHLTAALLPAMRAAGRGTVVNVTSTVQAVPLPLLGYYAASKAAFAQATRSLRHELGETPIRVLEVVPGGTDTALRDVDELPWKGAAPPTPPPVAPRAVAVRIVRAIERGRERLVYPRTSLLPIELPVLGRAVAAVAARRVDTLGALAAADEPR